MKFKNYYNKIKKEEIFEKVFKKYYNRGHWGNIEETELKEHQKNWYKKLCYLIDNKDKEALEFFLCEKEDNTVTKDLFSKLTLINVKRRSIKRIKSLLMEFCKDYGKR